jgi:hypothetical protein
LIGSNLNKLYNNVIRTFGINATPMTVIVTEFGEFVLLIVTKFEKINLVVTEGNGGISLFQMAHLGSRGS